MIFFFYKRKKSFNTCSSSLIYTYVIFICERILFYFELQKKKKKIYLSHKLSFYFCSDFFTFTFTILIFVTTKFFKKENKDVYLLFIFYFLLQVSLLLTYSVMRHSRHNRFDFLLIFICEGFSYLLNYTQKNSNLFTN